MKKYILKDVFGNKVIEAPEHSCLFCQHMTDVFWDYTHGPYMRFCELDTYIAGNTNEYWGISCTDFKEES